MYEFSGEKRSVASWAKKLDIPARELLNYLEAGKTIGQVEAEYSAASLPAAA